MKIDKGTTILDMIIGALKDNGYDGLYCEDNTCLDNGGPCGCFLDDICPCSELTDLFLFECFPAYKVKHGANFYANEYYGLSMEKEKDNDKRK